MTKVKASLWSRPKVKASLWSRPKVKASLWIARSRPSKLSKVKIAKVWTVRVEGIFLSPELPEF